MPLDPQSIEIPVRRGRVPPDHQKESVERAHYEDGTADGEARKVQGPHGEPWLNVLAFHEPGAGPALDFVLGSPALATHIRGRVLDVAAGTCWLSARISLLPHVDEVFALDLSEHFLTTTGRRMLDTLGADLGKITFIASDFNETPVESASIDCAFLFAALHHSLAPIHTLQEIRRCLRPGGILFIHEQPASVLRIAKQRRVSLASSARTTEIAYTLGELEYLIRNAGFNHFSVLPLPGFSRNPLKRILRKALRPTGLEHVLLPPPAYIFVVKNVAL